MVPHNTAINVLAIMFSGAIIHNPESMQYNTLKIQKSIDYIDNNLKSKILLDECARHAGFSTFHFLRLFKASFGVTVMQYIREKKLELAKQELINGSRIIDIAMDYGFSSERTFSRAFKHRYDVSPGKYRENADTYARFDYPQLDIEPRIVHKSSFVIAGFEVQILDIGNRENKSGINFWEQYRAENWEMIFRKGLHQLNRCTLGICFPGGRRNRKVSYVIGKEIDNLHEAPPQMCLAQIPEATYLVFTSPPANNLNHEFNALRQACWSYIYNGWLPKSKYEFDTSTKIDFELFDNRSDLRYMAQAELYVPVIEK